MIYAYTEQNEKWFFVHAHLSQIKPNARVPFYVLIHIHVTSGDLMSLMLMEYPELKTKKGKLPKRVRKVLPSISENSFFFFDAVCIKDQTLTRVRMKEEKVRC
jgi:hypothetical protein